ncbi:MAG: UvrD-helicase domain-containing protein [Rickettsiales bacterium]|jgi:ATP-dependent helicase/nuclease subunit A|nr:UvrD-helicase domain-containing protein [Rickettsiales bacterium]
MEDNNKLLSPEQAAASSPENNVWVQANAGTGKTTILIERLMTLLKNGADFGSILCLTYTNAAAVEIRERITDALEKMARAGQGELFYKYIDNMDKLKIQTMHGFCQEILRRFPIEAGVNPSWTLISDTDRNRIIGEVFRNMWNDQTDAELKEAFSHIMDKLSEWGFGELQKLIAGLYKDFFSLDFNFNNLAQFIETIRKSFDGCEFDKNAFLSPERMQLRAKYGEKLVDACTGKDGVVNALKVANGICRFAKGEISFEEYRSVFIKADFNKKTTAQIPEKKFGAELAMFVMAEQSELYISAQAEANDELLRDTAALYILVVKFAEGFRRAKGKAGQLDYDDLILYTAQLFNRQEMSGWVMSQLDSKIRHLMVDEAQDTSPGQWGIVKSILSDFFIASGRPSLFVVGDPKQSIYSFQGADLSSFFAAGEDIQAHLTQNQLEFQKINLETTYRTAQIVLDAVDYFFGIDSIACITKWKERPRHISGRIGAVGKVVVHGVGKSGNDLTTPVAEGDHPATIGGEFTTTPSAYASLRRDTPSPAKGTLSCYEPPTNGNLEYAKEVAGEIKKILDARPDLSPSDIMVLVKKRRPHADNIIAALSEIGIPAAGADRVALAKSLPVKDLLALMKFCVNQTDDFSLACALRSPLFGITEQELFKLCRERGEKTLWNVICSTTPSAEGGHPSNLEGNLSEIISLSKTNAPYAFLMKVLNANGRRENIIRRIGANSIDPLEEFLTLALSFERTQPGGLMEFIDWFVRGESEIKREMDNVNGVRILTIYGAKGLEAPVVFLVDTTAIRGKRDANPAVQVGEHHWAWSAGAGKLSALYAVAKDVAEAKDLEEYYRLLYVAMTRARDELHIFGCIGKNAVPENSWFAALGREMANFDGARVEGEDIVIEG